MRMARDDMVAKLLETLVGAFVHEPDGDMRLAAGCIMRLLTSDGSNLRFFGASSVRLLCSLLWLLQRGRRRR